MQKTKFLVEIHCGGSANDALIRMLTNHNEGKVSISLDLFRQYCRAKYAEFPTITPEFQLVSTTSALDVYEITGDKKKHTLTIIEKILPVDAEVMENELTEPT
jgi:hypothetical protein